MARWRRISFHLAGPVLPTSQRVLSPPRGVTANCLERQLVFLLCRKWLKCLAADKPSTFSWKIRGARPRKSMLVLATWPRNAIHHLLLISIGSVSRWLCGNLQKSKLRYVLTFQTNVFYVDSPIKRVLGMKLSWKKSWTPTPSSSRRGCNATDSRNV